MNITRWTEAVDYGAPNHFDMCSLRLQGFTPGGPEKFWVGLSHFLPGGGAGPDSSPLEKVYVLLSGKLSIESGGQTVDLSALDSCCIPPHEIRSVKNLGNDVATMLVVMPYPEANA